METIESRFKFLWWGGYFRPKITHFHPFFYIFAIPGRQKLAKFTEKKRFSKIRGQMCVAFFPSHLPFSLFPFPFGRCSSLLSSCFTSLNSPVLISQFIMIIPKLGQKKRAHLRPRFSICGGLLVVPKFVAISGRFTARRACQ